MLIRSRPIAAEISRVLMSSTAFFCRAVLVRGKTSKMDSIKSKMKNLAEATQEATTRANVYEEEIRRVNEIAEKFEEQVGELRAIFL